MPLPVRACDRVSPPRSRRLLVFALRAAVLAAFAASSSIQANQALAAEPPGHTDHGLLHGLTGPKLAIAAGVGLGIGATAAAFVSRRSVSALLSRSALAGLGVGTLVGIYVAHLALEAVLVGGVYYYWPSKRAAEDEPSHSMKLRIAPPTGNTPAAKPPPG